MTYRIRDCILALIVLCLIAPIFMGIMIVLWIVQRQVFFTQIRPGMHMKPFRIYKFATMHPLEMGETETDGQLHRITPIGKYLRQTSLDELPQILNILKGEMAFVGPRPLLFDWLDRYTPLERTRHDVLPGITGWAQVNGRNLISFKKKFAYDVWYVQNKSHLLDLKIMFMTLFVLFDFQKVNVLPPGFEDFEDDA